MNPRTTGLLFLVAALLGAFVFFYEIQGEEGRKQAEEQEGLVFRDVDAQDIRSISLRTGDGQAARAERRDGGWQVLEPVDFPGDAVTLDAMASTLAKLSSEGVIEDAQPPAVYGLDDEDQVVRFEVGDGSRELRFGRKTPVGSNSYASAGDGSPVYMVPTWRLNSLQKSLDEIRDRRILQFDRTTIDGFEASWPGGRVKLAQREGIWWTVEPVEGRADDQTVNDLLSELSFLRAEGFVDEPLDDAEARLDVPEFALTLHGSGEEGGEARDLQFALGRVRGDGDRLARGKRDTLYRVEPARLDAFPRKVVAYRFKKLSEFEVADAQRFELELRDPGSEPLIVEGTRETSGWVTRPEKMAAGKASNLVSELGRLTGSDILADSLGEDELVGVGLDPPLAVYRVWGSAPPEGEGEEPLVAHVEIGVIDADLGIVARARGGGPVYRIALDLAEHLPVSRDAFLNRFVSTEPDEPEEEDAPVDAEDPEIPE